MELIYDYLTGSSFRQHIEAIVEAWTAMRADLDAEKRVITKQWAKRSAQIESVLTCTTSMYGSLQGIAGRSVSRIDGLELQALEAP